MEVQEPESPLPPKAVLAFETKAVFLATRVFDLKSVDLAF